MHQCTDGDASCSAVNRTDRDSASPLVTIKGSQTTPIALSFSWLSAKTRDGFLRMLLKLS